MKIAFFSKELPSDRPNGVSCQVHRLANALCKIGHQITCISFSPYPEGALYEHIKLNFRYKSNILRKFEPAVNFRFVNTRNYDILHYHGDDYLVPGFRKNVRTFYGSALSEAIHAKKPGRFIRQSLFYIFEWLSCLRKGEKIGISNATKQMLPFVKKVIPCGVPLNKYHAGGDKTNFPSILFLGDLDSRKQGKYLINIFHNVILKKHPECILTIVGPQNSTGENIRYLGNLSEEKLISEYRKAWIHCLPSSYEGFGVPTIEAMACGTAVVVLDNPGVRDIVENGYNGLISGKRDIAHNICRLISDHELRHKLTENGGKTVAKHFDIMLIARMYETLYKSVVYFKTG